MSFCKLLWLLISLEEQAFLLLFIMAQKLRIEIGRVNCLWFVSPFGNSIVTIRSSDELVIMLFFPLLKLLWHWSINSCLKLLNLISIEAIVVQNLPFFLVALCKHEHHLPLLMACHPLPRSRILSQRTHFSSHHYFRNLQHLQVKTQQNVDCSHHHGHDYLVYAQFWSLPCIMELFPYLPIALFSSFQHQECVIRNPPQ